MSPTGKTARRFGFTLIELLVVLIGLSVVAAAIVPALRGAGRRDDLDAVASRIAATARFGRDTAVDRQRAMGITVETEPDGVRLDFQDEETQGDGASGASRRSAPGGDGAMPLPSAYTFVPLPSRVSAHLETAPVEGIGAAPSSAIVPTRSGAPGEDTRLRFPPDGRTEGGVVVLTDSRGRERRVAVMPETGVVRIEQGNE